MSWSCLFRILRSMPASCAFLLCASSKRSLLLSTLLRWRRWNTETTHGPVQGRQHCPTRLMTAWCALSRMELNRRDMPWVNCFQMLAYISNIQKPQNSTGTSIIGTHIIYSVQILKFQNLKLYQCLQIEIMLPQRTRLMRRIRAVLYRYSTLQMAQLPPSTQGLALDSSLYWRSKSLPPL